MEFGFQVVWEFTELVSALPISLWFPSTLDGRVGSTGLIPLRHRLPTLTGLGEVGPMTHVLFFCVTLT